MKVRLLRIVRIKDTKEEIQVPTEVDVDFVQCIYKDKGGVSLSLKNGRIIKVNHSLEDMVGYFNNSAGFLDGRYQ